MEKPVIKTRWTDRVVIISDYHKSNLRTDPRWTIRDTAKELGISYGVVCEAIKLASFLKTHEHKLMKIKSITDAMEWVRAFERERKIS